MLETPMMSSTYMTWRLVYATVLIKSCMQVTTSATTTFDVLNISGYNYLMSTTTADSEDAAADCSQSGYQLALFDTNAEFYTVSSFLSSYVRGHDPDVDDLLVDIRVKDDDGDGKYEHWWRQEELSKKVWAYGEPDSGCRKVPKSCCVRIYLSPDSGVLKDADCEKKYRYLCKPVGACSSGAHNCTQVCVDNVNGYTCGCLAGWILQTDGYSCGDVDECKNTERPCDQVCTNTAGSYVCSCDNGNTLDTDNKSCSALKGSEDSTVGAGSNVGEDTSPNTESCGTGRIKSNDTGICEDVDECVNAMTGCQHRCINTDGSYKCACYDNYSLDADNKSCVDMDECAGSVPPCNQMCVNTQGGYSCGCWEGYHDDASGLCTDINECDLGTHRCSHNCHNTNGSYTCSCRDGFSLADDRHGCAVSDTPDTKRCPCQCRGVYNSNTLPRWTDSNDKTIDQLSLDFHDLSSYKRTKISVADYRVTSQTLGYMGVVVFVGIFCFLTASDVVNFVIYLKIMIRKNFEVNLKQLVCD